MTFKEHKIVGDGIWIPKEELEEWKKEYLHQGDMFRKRYNEGKDPIPYPYVMGKADCLDDILKHFEK